MQSSSPTTTYPRRYPIFSVFTQHPLVSFLTTYTDTPSQDSNPIPTSTHTHTHATSLPFPNTPSYLPQHSCPQTSSFKFPLHICVNARPHIPAPIQQGHSMHPITQHPGPLTSHLFAARRSDSASLTLVLGTFGHGGRVRLCVRTWACEVIFNLHWICSLIC
jgi:hypothetical protein